MANLKEIRIRIASVKTTRQVTSAMKMVSAAKLKKAQDAILQIRPYAEKLSEILSGLSSVLGNDTNSKYAEQRIPEKVLIILVSSNRGLCGGFNSYVTKKAISHLKTNYKDQHKNGAVDFLAIGKQGEKILKSYNYIAKAEENSLFDNLTFERVSGLADVITKEFLSGSYDRVDIVYNKFINAAIQEPTCEQFLPIVPEFDEDGKSNNYDYIFEPSKEQIFEEMIPKSLKVQLYKTILDSFASENGARMTAMHKATDNASELINDLTLTFNKARQAAITNAILEVTNGSEALNS